MVGLIFSLAKELYAIDIHATIEVCPSFPLRKLPGTPAYIGGIATYRGEPLPVIDFNLLNGEESKSTTLKAKIIVLELALSEGEEQRVGLIVEQVLDTIKVPDNALLPNPVTLKEREFLAKCFMWKDNLVIYVETAQLLPPHVKELLRKEVASHG